MSEKAITKLDLKGLKCPLPVLKAGKVMRSLGVGDLLELTTTDPLAVIDIPAFCNENGHQLIDAAEYETHHCFLLKKGEK